LPKQKSAFWFQHDSNARHDEKMVYLKNAFGMAGYGLYWTLIEILREKTDYKAPIGHNWQKDSLYAELDCETIDTQDFIDTCVRIGLLRRSRHYLWSESLKERMKIYDEKRRLLAEAGKRGMDSRWKEKREQDAAKPRFHGDNKTDKVAITSAYKDVIAITAITDKSNKDIKTKVIVDKTAENQPTLPPEPKENAFHNTTPAAPSKEIVDLWNEITAGKLPKVTAITDKRRAKIKQRCAENSCDLQWWRDYFSRIVASEFCTGGPDGSAWKANFDFATRSPDVVARVLEGVYDHRVTNGRSNTPRPTPGRRDPWQQ